VGKYQKSTNENKGERIDREKGEGKKENCGGKAEDFSDGRGGKKKPFFRRRSETLRVPRRARIDRCKKKAGKYSQKRSEGIAIAHRRTRI